MPVRIRPEVAALPAYVAGKPAPLGPDGVSYKLSSNENPYPPLPSVLDRVAEAARGLNRYPDAANSAMTAGVAQRLGVPAEQLAFGTGSVAVLYHLLQATCAVGDEVIIPWRSFEAYPIAVQVTGANAVRVPLGPGATHDLDAMAAAVTERTRAVLLCTPNNPTGPAIDHEAMINFIDRLDDSIMVVVDEAYVEFVSDPSAARGLEALEGRDNVVVLRTFSKAYGLAGFRVGYCVAPAEIAEAVRGTSLPFGVSVVAQAAVLASLDVHAELGARVTDLVSARGELLSGLRAIGLEAPDSQGNFVWLPAGSRTEAWGDHFAAGGVMGRAYVAGDDQDGLRITVGEPEANQRVLSLAATLPDD